MSVQKKKKKILGFSNSSPQHTKRVPFKIFVESVCLSQVISSE